MTVTKKAGRLEAGPRVHVQMDRKSLPGDPLQRVERVSRVRRTAEHFVVRVDQAVPVQVGWIGDRGPVERIVQIRRSA